MSDPPDRPGRPAGASTSTEEDAELTSRKSHERAQRIPADEVEGVRGPEEMDSPVPDPDDPDSRRAFMKKLGIGAVAGAIGAAVGVPAFKYLAGTAIGGTEAEEWVQLAVADSVPLGEPTLFKSSVERRAGWIVTRRDLSVYVLTDDGQDFTVFSNVCTHLGCRVRWVNEQSSFFCPCHNAVFGRDGSVVAGPPPAPLEKFEFKVEDGRLLIKEA